MKTHKFILDKKTNAILSDALIEDMGKENLREFIKLGIYKEIALTEKQASEYSVLGLEDE